MVLLFRWLGVPLAGQSSLGEPLVAQVTATPGALCTQYSLQREECYKSPVFCKFNNIKGQLQCSTEPRERQGLTGPYFSFPTPYGAIPKTLLDIHPARKSVSESPSQRTYLEEPSFSLRTPIFLLSAFLEMRLEIIYKMGPYFRNV